VSYGSSPSFHRLARTKRSTHVWSCAYKYEYEYECKYEYKYECKYEYKYEEKEKEKKRKRKNQRATLKSRLLPLVSPESIRLPDEARFSCYLHPGSGGALPRPGTCCKADSDRPPTLCARASSDFCSIFSLARFPTLLAVSRRPWSTAAPMAGCLLQAAARRSAGDLFSRYRNASAIQIDSQHLHANHVANGHHITGRLDKMIG
jgi:hypothetical protein